MRPAIAPQARGLTAADNPTPHTTLAIAPTPEPFRAPVPPARFKIANLGRGVAIYEPSTNRFLYSSRAQTPLPPASLTKMVTALLVSQRLKPTDTLRISWAAANARADEIRWPRGARFTVDQVLHGMLIQSSNGAAIALAERVAGSVPSFIPILNAKARSLGAVHTHFVDPHGLDARGQYATAHDLALIAGAVLRDAWLARVVQTRRYATPWPGGGRMAFHTLNQFLSNYDGAIGVKTGHTSGAGTCLAAAATRHGVTLITVILHASGDITADTRRLMNYGFWLAKRLRQSESL